MADVTTIFSANTKIKSAEVNQNFQDLVDEFHVTTGHDHDGTDSKNLFPNATYIRQGSAPLTQAQNLTVSRFTISGIANEDAGVIYGVIGGNVGAVDRASHCFAVSFYKTGGTNNMSTVVYFGTTGGATAAYITIAALNATGDIVIQSITGAFGAGNLIGNLFITVIKNTTGAVVST